MICPNCEATMNLLFGTLWQCPTCRLEQYAADIEAYWAETGTVAYWERDAAFYDARDRAEDAEIALDRLAMVQDGNSDRDSVDEWGRPWH